MKQLNTFIFGLVMLFCFQVHAQFVNPDRFTQEIFDDVKTTNGLSYGANETILLLPIFGEAVSEDLLFDFYEPEGDDLAERPLVIMFHTGNFLPQEINRTVLGTRGDSSNVEIANRLARMGYAVANVDYRLGWNPTAPTQPERALGLIQAAYRGVQDARTAIRFFKRDYVENANSFRVDTSRITLWGIGTGGYVALNTAYLNTYEEIISTQFPAGKFILDVDGDQVPDVPMVIEEYQGDVEGKTMGVVPEEGYLGLPPGDVLCSPNHIDYSSEFHLVVNMAGALGDLTWMDNVADPTDNIPLINFHAPTDAFAPYADDVLIVPTTGDRIVQVQAGRVIAEKVNELGINDVFVDAGFDDVFTERARAASAEAGHDYFEGHFPVIRPLNPLGQGEGDPWQWWDAELWSEVLFDSTNNVSFDQASRFNNFDAGPEKGRIYIDTIIGYFTPRAYVALDLGTVVGVEAQLSQQEVGLAIAPNPANQLVRIQTNTEHPIEDIQMYDLSGKLIKAIRNVNANQYTLNRDGLPGGIYISKLKFKEGVVTQKIIFN